MFENIDKKKAILLTILIIAIIGVGYFLYWLWKPTVPLPIDNNNVGPSGNFPITNDGSIPIIDNTNNVLPIINGQVPGSGDQPDEIAQGDITATRSIIKDPAKAPSLTSGQLRYFNTLDGKFYELGSDGERRSLTTASYFGADTITWSPNSDKAVLEFPDGANIIYDFNLNKQFTLPREMENFSFSPTGSQVAGKFLGSATSDKWLVTINSDASNLVGVEAMGDNSDKVQVAWSPNDQIIALSRTGDPQGVFQQEVLLIGKNKENFKSLTIDGRGFESGWSPDGNNLIYSVFSEQTDYKPTLWVVEASPDRVGFSKRSIGLNTWSDQCTFASATIAYCSVPLNLPPGASFSREVANSLPSELYQVDLTSGFSTLIAVPVNEAGRGIPVTSLQASSDGQWLYFVDQSTGNIRQVRLK